MRSWALLITGLLSVTSCARGPEIPYDPDQVTVSISNQSGQLVVAIAAPAGTSFEDAVADHFVQTLGTEFKSVAFEYPNLSDEDDTWCIDQQYWVAKSLSGTVYLREDNYLTATNRNAAGFLVALEGPKWSWSDTPSADPDDFQVIQTVTATECFDTDRFVYGIEENLSVTAEVVY